ncbi:MAG TPA: hypothetical protein VGQ83_33030 [Polyangia bacterium]
MAWVLILGAGALAGCRAAAPLPVPPDRGKLEAKNLSLSSDADAARPSAPRLAPRTRLRPPRPRVLLPSPTAAECAGLYEETRVAITPPGATGPLTSRDRESFVARCRIASRAALACLRETRDARTGAPPPRPRPGCLGVDAAHRPCDPHETGPRDAVEIYAPTLACVQRDAVVTAHLGGRIDALLARIAVQAVALDRAGHGRLPPELAELSVDGTFRGVAMRDQLYVVVPTGATIRGAVQGYLFAARPIDHSFGLAHQPNGRWGLTIGSDTFWFADEYCGRSPAPCDGWVRVESPAPPTTPGS